MMLCPDRSASTHFARQGGFTLLELLVAMSVLSLLLILLLSMVSTASRLWKSNENRVDSYREARAAVNIIANDLSAIYPSPDIHFFFTGDDHLPATPVGTDKMNGSIFFLSAIPVDAQNLSANKSDLCTVGYFLGYDKTSLTGNGKKSYNLYRYFRSSDETFKAITAGDLLTGVKIDTSPTSADCEVLAKNVTGFKITPYTIPQPTADGASPNPIKFVKSKETPLPDMIDISVTTISNDLAKRFGDDEGAWENSESITRKQNDRTFKARIFLGGAAQAKTTPTPSP